MYVGETEKNVIKALRVAENNDELLFFDEADALFGKHAEIKDAYDQDEKTFRRPPKEPAHKELRFDPYFSSTPISRGSALLRDLYASAIPSRCRVLICRVFCFVRCLTYSTAHISYSEHGIASLIR